MSYLINTLLHPLSIFLGVLLIFIGVISYYFNNKLKEQNLKIDSIASVVSTMALEMRNIHGGNVQVRNVNDKFINLNTSSLDNENAIKHSLINVSDSDENNSSEDDSCDSYESESDAYESDGSEETLDNEDDNNNKNNKKILQHEYESVNIDENIIVLKIDNPFFKVEDIYQDLNEPHIENEVIMQAEDNIEFELKEDPIIENVELENVSDQFSQKNEIDLDKDNVEILLKSVEIDYKKMTLIKLKEIALEKGLIDETSKLKKQDLLKLLSN